MALHEIADETLRLRKSLACQTSRLSLDAWRNRRSEQNPEVCQFNLAYLEAVSGLKVALTARMLHGEHVWRLRVKLA